MNVPFDFLGGKGPLEAIRDQIRGASWGPGEPWDPNPKPQQGLLRSLVPRSSDLAGALEPLGSEEGPSWGPDRLS